MSKPIRHFEHVTPAAWAAIDASLTEAYRRAGNPSRLARTLKIQRNVLTMWKKHARLPTIQQAIAIESHFRVSRKSLRPDVDWNYIDVGSVPPIQGPPQAEKTDTALVSFLHEGEKTQQVGI